MHLATAPDQLTAEFWVGILRNLGIVAIIRPSDAASFLGVAAFGCRVQVAETDLASVPRAFAIGFENGENVLFDLDALSLRDHWYGDFARQRSSGKSWFWEPAARHDSRDRWPRPTGNGACYAPAAD